MVKITEEKRIIVTEILNISRLFFLPGVETTF